MFLFKKYFKNIFSLMLSRLKYIFIKNCDTTSLEKNTEVHECMSVIWKYNYVA